jgi:hypothetical protein
MRSRGAAEPVFVGGSCVNSGVNSLSRDKHYFNSIYEFHHDSTVTDAGATMNNGNPELNKFPVCRCATCGRLSTSGSFFKSDFLKHAVARQSAIPLTQGVEPAKVSREEMWGLISAIRAESRFEYAPLEYAPPAGAVAKQRFDMILSKIGRA